MEEKCVSIEKTHTQSNWLFLLSKLIRLFCCCCCCFNIVLVFLKAVDCRKPHSHTSFTIYGSGKHKTFMEDGINIAHVKMSNCASK